MFWFWTSRNIFILQKCNWNLRPLLKGETLKKWLGDIFENGSGGVVQKSLNKGVLFQTILKTGTIFKLGLKMDPFFKIVWKSTPFFKLFWKTSPDPFSKMSWSHFFKVSPFHKGCKSLPHGLCISVETKPCPFLEFYCLQALGEQVASRSCFPINNSFVIGTCIPYERVKLWKNDCVTFLKMELGVFFKKVWKREYLFKLLWKNDPFLNWVWKNTPPGWGLGPGPGKPFF